MQATVPIRIGPRRGFLALAFVLVAGLASCGDDDHAHERKASGAVCPPGSTLTYDTYGRSFMQSYCTRCHSSGIMGEARQGAPADHNFDSLRNIVVFADHIDQHAAAGPDATNADMPPSDPKPTDDERRKLGEWLACESAAKQDAGTAGDGGMQGDGSMTGDGGAQIDAGIRDATSGTEGGRG